jgi:N-acetylglutamate synthase-like GNAT family acetyltransferase
MMAIRRATPDDISAVDALLGRSYGPLLRADYPPSTLILALPRMARAQPRLLASGRYFLVEEEGALLGAGGWSVEPPGGGAAVPGLGHVRHVATDARAVRRGVGTALMDSVMADSAAEGMRRLSSLSTLTAVPFYAALGFRELRRLELSFGGGVPFPAVEMERDL